MTVSVTPDDEWLWHGWLDWTRENGLWQPWRLPAARVGRAGSADLAAGARACVGMCARVRTDATKLSLDLHYEPGPYPGPLDICVDHAPLDRHHLAPGPSMISAELQPGIKTVDIWLPHGRWAQIGELRLDGATVVEKAHARPRWITYGSSITRSVRSAGPSIAWPALIARRREWDLSCLAFSGECHLDQLDARAIRDRPAEVISLCIGINIYGSASLSRCTLGSALAGFIDTVRDGHPATPIYLISPLFSPRNEELTNAAGLTLREIRTHIAVTAAELVRVGDPCLHLIDGLTILGPDDADRLSDGVHPTAAGYRLVGDRLTSLLQPTPQIGRPR